MAATLTSPQLNVGAQASASRHAPPNDDRPAAWPARPPRPRLAYRVGVTGHRLHHLRPDQYARIDAEIANAVTIIGDALNTALADYAGFYDPAPPLCRLISPLADGADTLVAEAVLAAGWRLNVVTPFPIPTYLTDFAEAEASRFSALLGQAERVLELDGTRDSLGTTEAAYRDVGLATIEQSDLLLAIWDGADARGAGGTAAIVETAVRRGVPVLWINSAASLESVLLAADTSTRQGPADLKNLILHQLAPPASGAHSHGVCSDAAAATDFFAEVERRADYGLLFRLFRDLMCLRLPRRLSGRRISYQARAVDDWMPLAPETADLSADSVAALRTLLLPRYAWADGLASYYADLYRSSYTANYLLSAVAVFLALIELAIGGGKTPWITLEIIVIMTILAITLSARYRRWHQRWIDYRQLAELLRHQRFLFLVGSSLGGGRATIGTHMADRGGSWTRWYHRAAAREMGQVGTRASGRYKTALRTFVIEQELTPQIAYHRANAAMTHRLDHRLHRLGEVAFGGTLVVCMSYLLLTLSAKFDLWTDAAAVKDSTKSWITLITAFLPAAGAAMFGIRVQGEFGSTAERSAAMERQLQDIRRDLMDAAGQSLPALRRSLRKAADAMLIEVIDWRFVYSARPITLPA